MKRKKVARIREQRAKEAIKCVRLTGHDPRSGLLLDLGCGPGYFAGYLVKVGIRTVGVDVSRRKLKIAKNNVPRGSFILADGVKLPFREESFNTIVLNDVLEHVPYKLANLMLDEAKKTLTPVGKLYISVMNRYQVREPHSKLPFLTWLPRPCWNAICRSTKWKRPTYDCYPYTVGRLRTLCDKVGFTCKNYTWFYAWNKVSNMERIRDPTLKKMVKAIRKLKLSKLAYVIVQKVSVILFICEK